MERVNAAPIDCAKPVVLPVLKTEIPGYRVGGICLIVKVYRGYLRIAGRSGNRSGAEFELVVYQGCLCSGGRQQYQPMIADERAIL